MWLLIFHVIVNVLGLIFLIAGSLQILIRNTEKISKNRLVVGGWYLYTLGVILGAFLAKETYGYYWVWDLKETLSLLTLLGYFIYITVDMKKSSRVNKLVIVVSLILAIITLLVPTFTYSYHDPFNLP